MDAYVARQPIFDKRKKIYAYELLFRDGTANYVPDIDGDLATTTLLSNSFFAIGMDNMTDGKKSFINFTQNLLENKVPLLLPKQSTVIEILEDVKPESSVIEACREISQKGYSIALDDFEYSRSLLPLISFADIIKFDFPMTSREKIQLYVDKLTDKKRTYLAEKVETYEDFKAGLDMGFELFQGYFFCKPEIIHGKQIPGSHLNLMQIIVEINKESFEIKDLEKLISRDMAISYKLLRYINSAFFTKANKISSIHQALVYMGEEEIRRFVSLVAMSNLAKGKPNELIRTSCIRGKFCETLADIIPIQADSSELFTLGMFSLIDAIIDQSMETVMRKLPLSEGIVNALVKQSGELVDILNLAIHYEKGEWDAVSKSASNLGIEEDKLPELYMEACQWSNTVSKI